MRLPVDREPSAVRLLTRLFLRRLLDNDLISPHADRHESFVVLSASVLCLSIFVTFFVSTEYLAAFVQLPGPTALSALSDRFLFVGASMSICALTALLLWDTLPLEPRDAAILGPLPIPARAIARSKLAAALLSGAVIAFAVNAVPSVLYPAFLTLNLRGIAGGHILQLMAGQALATVLAGMVGFFTILALRSVLRLMLGEGLLRRVSGAAQGALVVCVVTALLLTPTVRATTVYQWIAQAVPARWPAVPALWYLGLNETVAGYLVPETPLVLPPPLRPTTAVIRRDDRGRAEYQRLTPQFPALARAGWLTAPALVTLAVGLFLWSNRHLPERAAPPRRRSRARAALGEAAERLTRGDPEAQAGFFFTLQTLVRSAPHRTILAIALAAGATLPFIALARSGVQRLDVGSAPVGVLAIQGIVLTALMAGFRYAVAVPAELASNWTIRLAWRGDERRYLAGVKHAAVAILIVAPVFVLLPLHVALFGISAAAVHALFGVLGAAAVLDALFLGYRKLPFACSYVPIENPKLVWPAAFASFLVLTRGFAYAERLALSSSAGTTAFGATLGGIVLVLELVDRARRRERRPVIFEEGPAPATQQLGIFERMAMGD